MSLKYALAFDSAIGGSPGTCITSPRSNNSKTAERQQNQSIINIAVLYTCQAYE